MLETERFLLRRWEDSDAESLFEYAKIEWMQLNKAKAGI